MLTLHRNDTKKILPIKVSQVIVDEFDDIKESEGLGNRASTFSFLVKYYKMKQLHEFGRAIDELSNVVDKIDPKKIPSAEEQLGLS
ncbi:hypothetical protein A2335_02215 [Candidatus Peregrinibacteria bacterium RIFOXYB2_FULL_32_7]|nr:MAG: hypothetical protein A2335_02215 [Candidatus Peregrinibacteria bacterium RIFOXYB2_FULL_32_7]